MKCGLVGGWLWFYWCGEKVFLEKKYVFDFFGVFKIDINYECYDEGCVFGEVVEYYGYLEKLVGFFVWIMNIIVVISLGVSYVLEY